MNVEVRYFSKFGNTKRIAEAIAEGANVTAKTVDEPASEYVDVMFLGGAPYANVMDPELRKFAEGLSGDNVGRVVLFTTSNWSRRTVLSLRKILKKKNIKVDDDYFYAHMLNVSGRIEAAKEFGKSKIENEND